MLKIIKRYKNRRLYDTEKKAEITLKTLGEWIEKGITFQVLDNSSGKDITLKTQVQILQEEIKSGKEFGDVLEIVRAIILKGGESTVGILKKSFLAGLGAFTVTKEWAEDVVEELIKKGELAKGDKAKAVREILDKAETKTKEIKTKVQAEVKKGLGKIRGMERKELETLKSQLDRLSQAIERLEKKLEK